MYSYLQQLTIYSGSKESLIDIAAPHLYGIKPNFKCFAWIDSDLEFDSITWPVDILKLLNGKYDIIQLFSHCNDLNKENETMNTYHSFRYKYFHNKKLYSPKQYSNRYSHPGFAWAMTRKCYEKYEVYMKSLYWVQEILIFL